MRRAWILDTLLRGLVPMMPCEFRMSAVITRTKGDPHDYPNYIGGSSFSWRLCPCRLCDATGPGSDRCLRFEVFGYRFGRSWGSPLVLVITADMRNSHGIMGTSPLSSVSNIHA